MVKRQRENRDVVLVGIKKEFRKFHRRHQGGRVVYSERLKKQAVSACAAGHSNAQVAAAAGVSAQTISNWQRGPGLDIDLRELRLVDAEETRAAENSGSLVVNIVLPSGVRIEVPTAALNGSLLADLWGTMR